MVEADAGANDDAAALQCGDEGAVDGHLVPDDDGVAGAERLGRDIAERAGATDVPIDIVARRLAFDDAVVGILRVRRQEAKAGHGCPLLILSGAEPVSAKRVVVKELVLLGLRERRDDVLERAIERVEGRIEPIDRKVRRVPNGDQAFRVAGLAMRRTRCLYCGMSFLQ